MFLNILNSPNLPTSGRSLSDPDAVVPVISRVFHPARAPVGPGKLCPVFKLRPCHFERLIRLKAAVICRVNRLLNFYDVTSNYKR